MECHFGERGIRTLDEMMSHTPLAGERLQPLGHLSISLILTFLMRSCNSIHVFRVLSKIAMNNPAMKLSILPVGTCSIMHSNVVHNNPMNIHIKIVQPNL